MSTPVHQDLESIAAERFRSLGGEGDGTQPTIGKMVDGGIFPALRTETTGAMQVALRDGPEILEAFPHACAPHFEQFETNRSQSRTLRDTLLPKLLSVELSVAGSSATIWHTPP